MVRMPNIQARRSSLSKSTSTLSFQQRQQLEKQQLQNKN